MWRWALVLAACSSSQTALPEPLSHHVVTLPTPLPLAIPAIHRRPIAILAITEDGDSAATADQNGAVRLWPTFDGMHEPLVVPAAPAMQLAIARAGDFAIAVVDQAGSLEIARVTATGQLRARTQVGGEPAVIEVIATNVGFLVERADQTIELVGLDGTLAGTLSPPHKVASIVYRRGRALALYESGGGRWIDLAGGLRWGNDTPAFTIDPKRAVLSPDHRHLAANVSAPAAVYVVDLATGTLGPPKFATGEPLGYTETGELVCGYIYTLTWWRDDTQLARRALGLDATSMPLGVGDHRVVTGEGQSLRLIDRDDATYLGYATGEPLQLRTIGTSASMMLEMRAWLVDGGARDWRVIDAPVTGAMIFDAVAIDDRRTLALTNLNDKRGFELDGVRIGPEIDGTNYVLHYEPSTRMIAAIEAGGVAFMRINDPVLRHLHTGETTHQDRVFLLDPSLANGLVAIVVDGRRVFEVHGDDLDLTHIHAHREYELGSVVTVDRAGRIYTRAREHDVWVHAGEHVVVLHGLDGEVTIVPNAGGTAIAAIAGGELWLFRGDGTLRWRVPAPETKEVAWRGGDLIGDALGVVRYDLVTGAIVERRCGTGFGLFATAPPFHSSAGRETCDAP